MIKYIDEMLSIVDIDDLKKKFIEFEAKLSTFSDEELPAKIKDAILFDNKGSKVSFFQSEGREYQKGVIFYRVRRLSPSSIKLKYQDFWEPPEHAVGYGRLNKPKERLLYLTPEEPSTPIEEVGVLEGEPFLLICYVSIDVINVFGLGFGGLITEGLSKDSLIKLQLIKDFIDRNFLSDRNLAYKVSSVIASDICDFNYDGWVYPSVANKGGENVCLKLSAKNKLKIEAAFICRLENGQIRTNYSISVGETIQVFNDWDSNNSKAKSILNNLFKINKESFAADRKDKQLREDIGFPIKLI
ncbi:hypothetical protein [Methylobacter sp.]|uniref:hypothetical protein n=1 Tax=Methylobacter sp. TaxID=2051955 RepID=UPI002FDE64C2